MNSEGSTSVTDNDRSLRLSWYEKALVRLCDGWTRLEVVLIAITLVALMVAVAATVAVPGPVAGYLDLARRDPAALGVDEDDNRRRWPLAATEDEGAISIVESGFSPLTSADGERHQVTWGLVVENTSATNAVTVDVHVAIIDDAGESLLSRDEPYRRRSVGLLLPGTRIGLGGMDYLTGPGVAALEIAFDRLEWWSPTEDCFQFLLGCPVPFPPVSLFSVELVEATYHPDRRPRVTLEVRVESEYERILYQFAIQGIFRNEDDEIVGGAPPDDGGYLTTIPPGWSVQRLKVDYPPPADILDLSRTELYAHSSNCC